MLQIKQQDKEEYERKKAKDELDRKEAELRYQKMLEDRAISRREAAGTDSAAFFSQEAMMMKEMSIDLETYSDVEYHQMRSLQVR